MTPLAAGGRVIDIHALECDDEVIAIFAGVADGHRFSMMFNTYTMSGNSQYSPGLILMRNIIDHYAGHDYRALDLGIGSDEYKRLFCKSDEPIFDSFIPLSLRGKMAAGAMSGVNRAKQPVKHNQRCSRSRRTCAACSARAERFPRHCEPPGRRKAPPDDRLREAIHRSAREVWIASSLRSSQ